MNKEIIDMQEITKFQSKSEEFCPMDWYKKMLVNEPIYYNKETDTWNVFKYKDVKQVLSKHEFFSSVGNRSTVAVGANNKEGQIPEKVNVAGSDPPKHQKSRSLLSAAFTPRSIKNWEPRIQEIANKLVHDMEANSTVDIVQQFSGLYPTMVMADLIGVPSTDSLRYKRWVDVLFQPYTKGKEQEIDEKKQNAAREYFEYLYPLVIQKHSNPSDDIISDLIKVELEGERFTDDEIVRTTMLLLGAGIETTGHMISSMFYSLLYDDTTLYEQLRNDLELVPNAVEEMLRYRFNISKRERFVKQDNNILGVELKKGDVVIAWMSAANMDEEMFENPFELNIHRPNNKKHLTFGNGPHFCLGAPLARLELNIALKTFLQNFSQIEPVQSFNLEENLTESAPGQSLVHLPLNVYQ
ncbi:cytochrome P450 [Salipaludibacillus neizhouensis]|uniref:Cytochrome P450 n=1 Tax=Salipaludibacillus neizhouensis TaxID=885475 RepID=A0A3A9JVL6_9BACI|nr:cytochrome P450 [Salipaludibacillus neizhouensis]RKL64974.1 cytochrome P450 [Salipaludibacillus neizhouensis]